MTPKKWILSVAFTAFALAMTQAQVSFGLRGGYQTTTIQTTQGLDDLTPDPTFVNAFSVAGVVQIPVAGGLSFQPELVYNRKGFSIRESTGANLFNVSVPVGVRVIPQFDYLDLPLLAKYSFGDENVKAFLMAGPSFGYALNGRLTTKAQLLLDLDLGTTNLNLDQLGYERFEVSGVLGAGVSFQTSVGQLFLDARYQHGFTQLYDIPLFDEKMRNQGLAFNIGWTMPLTK